MSKEKNKKSRILIVEDNSTNQKVAIHILRTFGYENIDVVLNGIEALNQYKKNSYDLILMDCQLPEMDGFEATKEIRKIESQTDNKHVPIIAMTAYAFKSDIEKCFACGMDDYIAKPVDLKLIESKLNLWLNAALPPYLKMYGIIDLERLNEIFGSDNKEGIREVIKDFVKSSRKTMKQLNTAINDKDIGKVKIAFHVLKGASGNLGIKKIYKLVIKNEKFVKMNEWDEIKKIYLKINKTLDVLNKSLSSF